MQLNKSLPGVRVVPLLEQVLLFVILSPFDSWVTAAVHHPDWMTQRQGKQLIPEFAGLLLLKLIAGLLYKLQYFLFLIFKQLSPFFYLPFLLQLLMIELLILFLMTSHCWPVYTRNVPSTLL